MRPIRILHVVVLVLVLLPSWTGADRLPLLRAPLALRAEPVALYPLQPEQRRLGRLTYLGGVALTSRDRAFGGYSAMDVSGDRFTLLSDGGSVLRFRMGADWIPRDVRPGALPAGPGTGWRKEDRDSEAMTVDPATGRTWVAFEGANAIWRYAPEFERAERAVAPRQMDDWGSNSGPEAMTQMPDGRFVVISEINVTPGRRGVNALAFAGDPTIRGQHRFAFRYRVAPGFRVTDMAALPDGRVVVLSRRVSLSELFSARVEIVAANAIRPRALVRGRTLAVFGGGVTRDNMEGIAVAQEGDATILWIVSDDNEAWWQRTLLMKFRLDR